MDYPNNASVGSASAAPFIDTNQGACKMELPPGVQQQNTDLGLIHKIKIEADESLRRFVYESLSLPECPETSIPPPITLPILDILKKENDPTPTAIYDPLDSQMDAISNNTETNSVSARVISPNNDIEQLDAECLPMPLCQTLNPLLISVLKPRMEKFALSVLKHRMEEIALPPTQNGGVNAFYYKLSSDGKQLTRARKHSSLNQGDGETQEPRIAGATLKDISGQALIPDVEKLTKSNAGSLLSTNADSERRYNLRARRYKSALVHDENETDEDSDDERIPSPPSSHFSSQNSESESDDDYTAVPANTHLQKRHKPAAAATEKAKQLLHWIRKQTCYKDKPGNNDHPDQTQNIAAGIEDPVTSTNDTTQTNSGEQNLESSTMRSCWSSTRICSRREFMGDEDESLCISCTQPDCHKKFRLERSLKDHLGRIHKLRVWKCEVEDCPTMFKTLNEVRLHVVYKHKKTKDAVCKICNKEFARHYLKLHQATVHSSEEKAYVVNCDYCEKKFKTKLDMSNHIRAVHRGKQHICSVCNRGFAYLSQFKSHELTHGSAKEFKCTEPNCGKEYFNMTSLKSHLLKHKKAFLCDKCGYSCNTLTLLEMHRVTHTKEAPELCPVCGKQYRKRYLKAHINKMHSKTFGSFVCEHCERSFKKKEEWEMHIKPHQSNRHSRGECWKWYAEREGRVVVRRRKPHKKFLNRKKSKKSSTETENDSDSSMDQGDVMLTC